MNLVLLEELSSESHLQTIQEDEEDKCVLQDEPSHKNTKTSWKLFPGASGPSHDEELHISGNKVTWSSKGRIHKSYTLDAPIINAIWCTFANPGQVVERSLCILQRETIHIYEANGEYHIVSLPCKGRNIWALPYGLLVERYVTEAHISVRREPIFFSLLHPLEELKPISLFYRNSLFAKSLDASTTVSMLSNASSSSSFYPSDLNGDFFCEPAETVVFTCLSQPFIITYNAQDRIHTAWALRQSRTEIDRRSRFVNPEESFYSTGVYTNTTPRKRQEISINIPEGSIFSDLKNDNLFGKPVISSPPSRSLASAVNTDKEEKFSESSVENQYSITSSVCDGNISSEVHIENIWKQYEQSPKYDSVFLASNIENQSLICLFSKQTTTVYCYRFSNTGMSNKPIARISALAAVPIQSARNCAREAISIGESNEILKNDLAAFDYDILVLEVDGILALYTGDERLCSISFEVPGQPLLFKSIASFSLSQPARRRSSIRIPANIRLVDLRDPVHNRISLVYNNGKTYRVRLPSAPRTPLVKACLQAFSTSIPAHMVHWFRVDLIRFKKKNPKMREWDLFKSLVLFLLKSMNESPQHLKTWHTHEMPGIIPGKNRQDSSSSNDAWKKVLSSEFHKLHADDVDLETPLPEVPVRDPHVVKKLSREKMYTAGFALHMDNILKCLHLLYENFKLSTLLHCHLKKLAALLLEISSIGQRMDYVEHYTRDFGDLRAEVPLSIIYSPITKMLESPQDIHKYLFSCLRGFPPAPFPILGSSRFGPFELVRKMCLFYDLLTRNGTSRSQYSFHEDLQQSFQSTPFAPCVRRSSLLDPKEDYPLFSPSVYARQHRAFPASSPAERLVLAMVQENVALEDLEYFTFGIKLPILEALRSSRHNPPGNWPIKAYDLVGRDDLSKNLELFASTSQTHSILVTNSTEEKGKGKGSTADQPNTSDISALFIEENSVHQKNDPDGTLLVLQQGVFRFGRDQRLKEVRRLLRSSRKMCLRVPNLDQMADVQKSQQLHLLFLSQRLLASHIGRGMFTVASITPLLTEDVTIPDIMPLVGRVPPKNILIELDEKNVPPEIFEWPRFHNGVAAGLRIAPGKALIDRVWINFHRPEELTYEHAGLLYAFGLQGYLNRLTKVDLYNNLQNQHQPTMIGMLLGLAATYRGTMDVVAVKLTSLHISTFVPVQMEMSPDVQTAALLAYGLLYQGTAHPYTSQILLDEIGSRPAGEKIVGQGAYSLAAGLALGLVCLGRGKSVAVNSAKMMVKLELYINGGRSETPPKRPVDSSRVKQGDIINTDLTAPGATLALGLMYLKTNDKATANRLSIPTTHFALDYVRPDFSLLRTLSRNLILWDSVEPSEEWMNSQIPPLIMKLHKVSRDDSPKSRDIDFDAIRQTYCNLIAGACFSLGLRFAGSANLAAFSLISNVVKQKVRVRKGQGSYEVDRGTLETCLSVCALSMGLVMAGTGNLKALSQLRALRSSDTEVPYGSHMALSMAIGFLFLGGGRYTLSTSKEAIAMLVCALFPRFPVSTDDNLYHLQAFRHLYVLAIESRYFEMRDVDTGKACYVPIHVEISPSTTLSLTTPCLLPDYEKVSKISVNSARYWCLSLDLVNNSTHSNIVKNNRVIYVKRKTGYLSYEQDPKGLRGIMCRPFPKNAFFDSLQWLQSDEKSSDSSPPTTSHFQRNRRNKADFVRSFSADVNILAFAQHFCNQPSEMGTFCTSVLYECFTREKPEMLQTYLAIYRVMDNLSEQSNSIWIWNVKLVLAYYSGTYHSRLKPEWIDEPLIQPEFIQSIEMRLNKFFREFKSPSFDQYLQNYIRHGSYPQSHAAKFSVRDIGNDNPNNPISPLTDSAPSPVSGSSADSLSSLNRSISSMSATTSGYPHSPIHPGALNAHFLSGNREIYVEENEDATELKSQKQSMILFGCFLTFFEIPRPEIIQKSLHRLHSMCKKLPAISRHSSALLSSISLKRKASSTENPFDLDDTSTDSPVANILETDSLVPHQLAPLLKIALHSEGAKNLQFSSVFRILQSILPSSGQ